MIIDCNALYGFWPRGRVAADIDTVRELARAHGIDKSLICSLRGVFDDFVRGNAETLAVCQKHSDLIPVATINPHRWLGVEDEIDNLLSDGVKVFRFFPEYQHWPYRFMPFYRILERLEGTGSLVMVPARVGGHQNNGVMTDIADLASNYDLTFVITGVFYGNLAEAIAVAQSKPNIMLETHLLNSPDGFEVLVEEVGPERLIYGSKTPLHPINASLLPLVYGQIEDSDKEKILSRNIQGILE